MVRLPLPAMVPLTVCVALCAGLLVGRLLDGWSPVAVVTAGAVVVLIVFAAVSALTDAPTARTAVAVGRGLRGRSRDGSG